MVISSYVSSRICYRMRAVGVCKWVSLATDLVRQPPSAEKCPLSRHLLPAPSLPTDDILISNRLPAPLGRQAPCLCAVARKWSSSSRPMHCSWRLSRILGRRSITSSRRARFSNTTSTSNPLNFARGHADDLYAFLLVPMQHACHSIS